MHASSSSSTSRQRGELVKRFAGALGFAACGICSAAPSERRDYVLDWLRAGCHGSMDYLKRNVEVRLDPGRLVPGARSVIVVAWLCRVRETADGLPHPLLAGVPSGGGDGPSGWIARYAWGRDYHRAIRQRLRLLVDQLRAALDVPFESRVCVDTAPLLERELAQRAGVGWIGVNCMVLNRSLGSYFCLGEVVTTLDLAPDEPAADGCGSCRRCLLTCPTGAITAPHQMDPRRCISYLTIERRDEIPPDLQGRLAGRIFGCDICQQVCPWNGTRAAISIDPDTQPRVPAGRIDPQDVLAWQPADWDALTRGRALRRATLAMWRRNAQRLARAPGGNK